VVNILGELGDQVIRSGAVSVVNSIDFNQLLLHGLLAYLLFAGGLNLKFQQLSSEKIAIAMLATLGVAISTVVVGFGTWLALDLVGLKIPLVAAFLFGTLISPTDPGFRAGHPANSNRTCANRVPDCRRIALQ